MFLKLVKDMQIGKGSMRYSMSDLIETLQLIADEGKRSHYKGFSKEPPKVI
jgi:hypothetical protein